eukprot:CAMPEP_0185574506 /NCGR_PEP_ID=MMETSP0434-20130131/5964_1 /TAXON_ID=626734 ORGANISM="Favella taraikaensis, Strain Fe Narragansett Bay" /NCGR_SAMPLE_ID=MMETSP0434 /ASSEMBLY_ACC=CAM_ASM_000379 /LENGTH=44 /DNA_ID= /DNA_START= /DNA_END= /DNA_ORIENTATION=
MKLEESEDYAKIIESQKDAIRAIITNKAGGADAEKKAEGDKKND